MRGKVLKSFCKVAVIPGCGIVMVRLSALVNWVKTLRMG